MLPAMRRRQSAAPSLARGSACLPIAVLLLGLAFAAPARAAESCREPAPQEVVCEGEPSQAETAELEAAQAEGEAEAATSGESFDSEGPGEPELVRPAPLVPTSAAAVPAPGTSPQPPVAATRNPHARAPHHRRPHRQARRRPGSSRTRLSRTRSRP
jgi:hypothetical protein